MEIIDLSYFLNTKDQATDFSASLAAISEKVYQSNFNLEKTLLEEFGIQKKDKFIKLLKENKIDIKSNVNLKKFLEAIQTIIEQLPILSITIAFQPKEKTLKLLSEWFILHLKKQILLDITVDPNLIAGATISFKGKYIDLSIRPTLERSLKKIEAAKASPEKPIHQNIENLSFGR